MSQKQASLDQIERWMQSVIMHPGGVAEGVDSPEARRHLDVSLTGLESVIRPSAALSSRERLEIYVDAYHERLLECLREEFLSTRHALGDELFDAMAFGYLQREPSRSYTLAKLGAGFPGFLSSSRLHAHGAPADAGPTWGEFVIELATFERLLHEVFDGPGCEQLGAIDSEQLLRMPPENWGQLRLVAAPCLRLHRCQHPVHLYWADLKTSGEASVPCPTPTYLAVNRRDYRIEYRGLDRIEFELLSQIVLGRTLSETIGTAAENLASDWQLINDRQLADWFSAWASAVYFLKYEST